MAAKVKLPEKFPSFKMKPPVELFPPIELRFTVGEEGAVITPYYILRYRDDRGERRTVLEFFVLLFRREGGSFVPVRPLYRLPLLEVGEEEVGVDVYRSSDVPDDTVVVSVEAFTGLRLGWEKARFFATAEGRLDEKERHELKRLLERYAKDAYLGRDIYFSFFHEDCMRPVRALGEKSGEDWGEEEEECALRALRLPAGEYLLLPKSKDVFFTFLVHGRGDWWTSDWPQEVLNLKEERASVSVYEPPSPEDGYMLFLVTGSPTRGLKGVYARRARRVHMLDYRLPPDEIISIEELIRQAYDTLAYYARDWDLEWWEVEDAVKEAIF